MLRARLLVGLASLLLLLSVLTTWIHAQIIDTDGWTQTSVHVLENAQVRTAVSGALSERLLGVIDAHELAAEKLPPALAPLAGALSTVVARFVPPAVEGALASSAVQHAWEQANRAAHAQVMKLLDGGGRALSTAGGVVSLNLEAVLDKLGTRLGLGSGVGRRLPPDRRRLVLLRSSQLRVAQRGVRLLRDLSFILPLLALLLYVAALTLAAGLRRRVLLEVGVGVLAAALLALVLRRWVESYVVDGLVKQEALRPAIREVFQIATAGWRGRADWLTVTGAVVLLAALLAGPSRWAVGIRRLLTDPLDERPAWFVAAVIGLVLLIAALVPISTPGQALALLLELALACFGVLALRRQVQRERAGGGPEGRQRAVSASGGLLTALSSRPRLASGTSVAIAGIAIAVVIVVALANSGTTNPTTPVAAVRQPLLCNGLAQLCSRRIDEVVFPATHNSMSATSEGFRFANQGTGIAAQLQGGIRGLLIDTHPGVLTPKGVYTVLHEDSKSHEKLVSAIGKTATTIAKGIRAKLGYRGGGNTQVYLCHGYCELGASLAVDQFRAIREFLDSHPDEVLLISVEDGTSPQSLANVVKQSGLLSLVWRGSLAPSPTLGNMVARDQRVVFMVEGDPGTVPWLHAQFKIAGETRYNFASTDELLGPGGCAANRGGTAPPLLLINMFVDSFPPSNRNSTVLNRKQTIVEHARKCSSERHRTPTMIAVDQWQIGDVVGAARELNEDSLPSAGAG